jgi:hypothetical protein
MIRLIQLSRRSHPGCRAIFAFHDTQFVSTAVISSQTFPVPNGRCIRSRQRQHLAVGLVIAQALQCVEASGA